MKDDWFIEFFIIKINKKKKDKKNKNKNKQGEN